MQKPDLDKFSKELTDTINGGLKSGVPMTFVSMALDMASFELKGKHIEMLKTMQNDGIELSARSNADGSQKKIK
jgi:hypothetical protein